MRKTLKRLWCFEQNDWCDRLDPWDKYERGCEDCEDCEHSTFTDRPLPKPTYIEID